MGILGEKNNNPIQEDKQYWLIKGLALALSLGALLILLLISPEVFLILMFFCALFIASLILPETDKKLTPYQKRLLDKEEEEYDNDAQLAPKAHLIILSPMPDIQEIAQSHAIGAVQAVGINPNWASLLPLDIGFIGFVLNQPTIYRITPIPSTIHAIQPFVKLRARHATTKQVRFDVQDDKGVVVFRFERQYKLRIGENLITPPARMPILSDSPVNGVWKLCLWVNDEPLAEHRFGWETPFGGIVMMPVSQDGEISEELTSEFEAHMDEISLDELLGNDDQLSQKQN